MNELQIFSNEQFGDIRVSEIDGKPWFVAADVCKALEHSNVSVAIDRLDDDEKAKLNLGLAGGEINVISEAGLYVLVLGSRKPEAKAFKRWITHDVLPTIRKLGVQTLVTFKGREKLLRMFNKAVV
jgi:anti-repressor protein